MGSGQESTRDGRPGADRSRRIRWLKRLTVLIVVGGGATVGFTLAAEAAVAGPVRPGDRPHLIGVGTAAVDGTVAGVSAAVRTGVGDGQVLRAALPAADGPAASDRPARADASDRPARATPDERGGAAPGRSADVPPAPAVTVGVPATGPTGDSTGTPTGGRRASDRRGTDLIRPTDCPDRAEHGTTHRTLPVTPSGTAVDRIGASIGAVGCGLTTVTDKVRSVPRELTSVVHAVVAALRPGRPAVPPHPSGVVPPQGHQPTAPTVPAPTRPSPVLAQRESAPVAGPTHGPMGPTRPGPALGAVPTGSDLSPDRPAGTAGAVAGIDDPRPAPPTHSGTLLIRAGVAGSAGGDPPPALSPVGTVFVPGRMSPGHTTGARWSGRSSAVPELPG